jgi:hypothetical protein
MENLLIVLSIYLRDNRPVDSSFVARG